jgi:hypothetical protein
MGRVHGIPFRGVVVQDQGRDQETSLSTPPVSDLPLPFLGNTPHSLVVLILFGNLSTIHLPSLFTYSLGFALHHAHSCFHFVIGR